MQRLKIIRFSRQIKASRTRKRHGYTSEQYNSFCDLYAFVSRDNFSRIIAILESFVLLRYPEFYPMRLLVKPILVSPKDIFRAFSLDTLPPNVAMFCA